MRTIYDGRSHSPALRLSENFDGRPSKGLRLNAIGYSTQQNRTVMLVRTTLQDNSGFAAIGNEFPDYFGITQKQSRCKRLSILAGKIPVKTLWKILQGNRE